MISARFDLVAVGEPLIEFNQARIEPSPARLWRRYVELRDRGGTNAAAALATTRLRRRSAVATPRSGHVISLRR